VERMHGSLNGRARPFRSLSVQFAELIAAITKSADNWRDKVSPGTSSAKTKMEKYRKAKDSILRPVQSRPFVIKEP
jgi:hypothetical protein